MKSTDDLGSLASVMQGLASTPDESPRLARGDVIDETYRIERELGGGGMGVVYLARDLRLDRDVAIKVGRKVASAVLAEHEREAKALAKLAHPNVVVVHAVGEWKGRMFLAMEYVAGGTLREWIGERTWREIVAIYAAAGDGLAAAHAAGIVHRDFKPENVLVGVDGRPRVADFGIAWSPDAGDARVAGTPEYMAPEQQAGAAVDARADQFAFCVAVWEALFGVRPEPNPPAPSAKVPAHVVAALQRGLAAEPAERWPALAPLLAELRRDPAIRRRRLAIVGAVAVVAIATGSVITSRAMPAVESPCEDAPAAIAAVWNPARAARLGERFERADLAGSGRVAVASLDAYATRWALGRSAACRATRIDGSQSEALLERRTICLEDARQRLDATAAALERGALAVLADAGELRATLPDLARCDDVTALAKQESVPSDPAARARIDATQALLASARTASDRGRDTPVVIARQAVAEARATHWQPIVAEAIWALAQLQSNTGTPVRATYEEATRLALASGNDEIAAWSLADLAWELGESGEAAPARYNAELAHAIWKRLGSPAELGVRVAGAEALAAIAGARFDDALAATHRQVELARTAYGDDALPMAANHYNLAHALQWAGRHAEARTEIDRAIEIATPVVGPNHPLVARYLTLAATLAHHTQRGDEAVAYARRALAILERWYGTSDVRLSSVLYVLGGIAVARGDRELAETTLARAIALASTQHDSMGLAELKVNLAVLYVGLGKLDRALALGLEALAAQDAGRGPGSAHSIKTLVLLGYVERALGHHDTSVTYMERAVRASATLASHDHDAINARVELANSFLAANRPRDAAAALEPAIAAIEANREAVADHVVAEANLVHAAALWATGARDRARRAAAAARDIYHRLGTRYAAEHAAAESWLARHR